MKRYILILLFLTPVVLNAQNAFDSKGLRSGPWKGYYPDSTLRYEGTFEKGKPVGLMKRYDEYGNLNAEMDFIPETDRCMTTLYSNGAPMAKGVYLSQEKDGKWEYFAKDGSIRMIEYYDKGILNGPVKNYYPNGGHSQVSYYFENILNGPLVKFFENGDTMLIANYSKGTLDGKYFTNYPGGIPEIRGWYFKDKKDKNWIYLSEEGDTLTVLKYDKGTILNPEELEKQYKDFFEGLDELLNSPPAGSTSDF